MEFVKNGSCNFKPLVCSLHYFLWKNPFRPSFWRLKSPLCNDPFKLVAQFLPRDFIERRASKENSNSSSSVVYYNKRHEPTRSSILSFFLWRKCRFRSRHQRLEHSLHVNFHRVARSFFTKRIINNPSSLCLLLLIIKVIHKYVVFWYCAKFVLFKYLNKIYFILFNIQNLFHFNIISFKLLSIL